MEPSNPALLGREDHDFKPEKYCRFMIQGASLTHDIRMGIQLQSFESTAFMQKESIVSSICHLLS